MQKSFPHQLFVLFFLLFAVAANAQQELSLGSQNICLSPPLPPYFLPMDTSPVSDGERSSNYKIPFDTIRFNPTLGTQAFDVVICLDGVTNNTQIHLADRYVDSLINRLQTIAHYNPRFKYFNVYRVAKLSNDEGAAWGYAGDTVVDNRYGSRFNAFGLPRLIIPEKYDTLFADADEFVPQHDLVLNLCYDKKYGGSGWSLYDGRKVASFTIDEQTGWHLGDEVACHEMQHIMPFAGHGFLGDEYEDTLACPIYDTLPIAYLTSPNFTGDTVSDRKWEHCMSQSGVGFYPNAGICPGNYRPATTCTMHQVYDMPPFCPVCREHSTAYFDSIINPVYNVSASPVSFVGNYTFSVHVDTLSVNTFRYQWFLDDTIVASAVDSFSVNFSLLNHSANHVLKFVCTDVDAHIIDTTLRRPWITQWNLLTQDSTVGFSVLDENSFSISPNPAKNEVTVQSSLLIKTISICNVLGQVVFKNESVNDYSIRTNIASFPEGIYMVTALTNNGVVITRKLMVEF